jgi:hypothetical protein
MSKKTTQCEGWHHTPAFVLGGEIGWHQCKADAVWMVTFRRHEKGKKPTRETLPACDACLEKCRKDETLKILISARIQPLT